MEERRKNPTECTCLWHTGQVVKIEALCRKLDEREKQVNIQLDALKEAIITAKSELERRLAGLNELRQEVTSDRSRFVTCEAYDAQKEINTVWRRKVDETITKLETRSITWGAAITLAVILINLALHFWK